MPDKAAKTRAIATAVSGLLILAFNVLDAADRGASAFNFLSITIGVFLLFYGFTEVARIGAPPKQ